MDLIECLTMNPEPLQDPVKQAEVVKKKRQKTIGLLTGSMGVLNCHKYLAVINEENPFKIWKELNTNFTLNSVNNKPRVFLESLALRLDKGLDEFISSITRSLGKLALVGIIIGSPGDIN
ncbi:hypothetical protein O181_121792 [Austropuccinia psidii MF-1]|uniref:Uncharacterized protein n=1 Tax=Austropuccinia psidii MF-1 TaxID=1389203 RepID=A0A9Q3KLU3_9BASI|nr:hypothetical protein [Austropuccinia psidii MF-1]